MEMLLPAIVVSRVRMVSDTRALSLEFGTPLLVLDSCQWKIVPVTALVIVQDGFCCSVGELLHPTIRAVKQRDILKTNRYDVGFFIGAKVLSYSIQ